MSVAFVDIDGVMNTHSSIRQFGCNHIGDEHLKLLKLLIDKTQAEIVISSTWREYPSDLALLKARFLEFGLVVLDCTLVLRNVGRFHEIQAWLDDHPAVDKFVILDDYADAEIKGHFIHINPKVGLQAADIEKAVAILS